MAEDAEATLDRLVRRAMRALRFELDPQMRVTVVLRRVRDPGVHSVFTDDPAPRLSLDVLRAEVDALEKAARAEQQKARLH